MMKLTAATTCEQLWEDFRKQIFPPDLTSEELHWMKTTFYSGMWGYMALDQVICAIPSDRRRHHRLQERFEELRATIAQLAEDEGAGTEAPN